MSDLLLQIIQFHQLFLHKNATVKNFPLKEN